MDGMILPDVPFEEKEEFASVAEKYGLDLISLVAPTSHEKISMIAKEAEGFGISEPKQAKKMAAQSDGVIVASAIVKLCEKYGADCVPHISYKERWCNREASWHTLRLFQGSIFQDEQCSAHRKYSRRGHQSQLL